MGGIATTSSPCFAGSDKKPRSLKERLAIATTYMSMGLCGASGACLIGSGTLDAFIPKKPESQAIQKTETPTVSKPDPHAGLKWWRDTLQQTGMGMVLVSYFTGVYGEIGASIKAKQPNYALGNILFIPLIPFMAVYPNSVAGRGTLLILLGTIYGGYANVVKNKYEPDNKDPERNCDMDPLLDAKLWEQAKTDPAARQKLLETAGKTAKYVIEDHLLLLKSLGHVPQQLKQTVISIGKAGHAVLQGNKLEIPPSSERTRFAALCYYVGGGMLALSATPPGVALTQLLGVPVGPIGSIIAGVGTASKGIETFAIGTQRDDWMGTALKIGTPLQYLGDSFIQNDIGYGLRNFGEATAYTLTLDMYQNTDEPPENSEGSQTITETK